MWPGNLAPDHPDLGPPNSLLSPVNIGNLLAKVEPMPLRQHLAHDA